MCSTECPPEPASSDRAMFSARFIVVSSVSHEDIGRCRYDGFRLVIFIIGIILFIRI